jgi:hypothetical protein
MFQKFLLALIVAMFVSSSASAALITLNNHEVQPGDQHYVFDVYWGKETPGSQDVVSGNFGDSEIGKLAISSAFYFSDPFSITAVAGAMSYLGPDRFGTLEVKKNDAWMIIFSRKGQLFVDAWVVFGLDSSVISVEPFDDGYGATFTYPIRLPNDPGSGGGATGHDQVPELTGLATWLIIGPIILFGLSGAKRRNK